MNELSCRESFSSKSRSHLARDSHINVFDVVGPTVGVCLEPNTEHMHTMRIARLACPARTTKRRNEQRQTKF